MTGNEQALYAEMQNRGYVYDCPEDIVSIATGSKWHAGLSVRRATQ